MWDFTAGNIVPPTGYNEPHSGYVPHTHAPSNTSHSPLRMPTPVPGYGDPNLAPTAHSHSNGQPDPYMPIPVASRPSLYSSQSNLSLPPGYAPAMTIRGPTPEPYSHHHHHDGSDHERRRRHSFSNNANKTEPTVDRGLHLGVPNVIHVRHHRHSHSHSHSHSLSPIRHDYATGPRPSNVHAPSSPGAYHKPLSSHPAYHPSFQYSKCTGRKKALCIGINYIGQENELRGCINDAEHVRDFLIRHHHFRPENIVLLADNRANPREQPTRRNIIDAMRWLVKDAQPHDSLWFSYSGHGGQTPDLNGDEIDGMDEVIFPVDFRKRGHIIDDDMHTIMVKPLPAGCRLTALFDSCHSGTVLDLPFIYASDGRIKGAMVTARARRRLATPADVISFSACKDGQKSVDTFKGGVAVGAMSWAFIKSLKNNPNQSYQHLLKDVRQILMPKYTQKPQLGSSHHIDTSLKFVI